MAAKTDHNSGLNYLARFIVIVVSLCVVASDTSAIPLTFSGDTAIVQTEAERFGSDNGAAWTTNFLDWATAPVDLSFLNAPEKPAGKHGFLRAIKDRLVFADGTLVRFWGTNVAAYSLFATNSQGRQAAGAATVAARLQPGAVSPHRFGVGCNRMSSA